MATKRMDRAALESFTRSLADRGEIIEAGWIGFSEKVISENAPQVQIDEMHNAFFSGAHHLFYAVIGMLSDEREPTEDDLRRMGQLQSELDYFIRKFNARHGL